MEKSTLNSPNKKLIFNELNFSPSGQEAGRLIKSNVGGKRNKEEAHH